MTVSIYGRNMNIQEITITRNNLFPLNNENYELVLEWYDQTISYIFEMICVLNDMWFVSNLSNENGLLDLFVKWSM